MGSCTRGSIGSRKHRGCGTGSKKDSSTCDSTHNYTSNNTGDGAGDDTSSSRGNNARSGHGGRSMGDSSTISCMGNSDPGDNAYNDFDTAHNNTGDSACNSLGGPTGSSNP